MKDYSLNSKIVLSLSKWTLGAVARRNVRKLLQLRQLTSLKKPEMEGMKVGEGKELLFSDNEVAI
jgi:hypothetical protein